MSVSMPLKNTKEYFIVKIIVNLRTTGYRGRIVLYFNLRKHTSKGPFQQSLKVLRGTREKPTLKMGSEDSQTNYIEIYIFLKEHKCILNN